MKKTALKKQLTHASYIEWQASLFGACSVALGLGAIASAFIGRLSWWLVLIGSVIHSVGMYRIHRRNQV